MEVHHFGLVVPDLDRWVARAVHRAVGEAVFDPAQRCHLQLASPGGVEGPPWIEFIAPADEQSPVWNALRKHGAHWHHLCFRFPGRAQAETYVREHGLMPVTPWKPAVLFGGRPVAFFYARDQELIEILADEE